MKLKNSFKIILFFCVAILHLFVLFWIVRDNEQVLTKGTPYKFKAMSGDPYDFSRGKYIRIHIKNDILVKLNSDYKLGEPVYALLALDKDGFAYIDSIQRDRPLNNNRFFKTKISRRRGKKRPLYTAVEIPFDRYYMEETLPSKAYNTYILVRVLNGKTRIEQVFINDIPIEKFLRELKQGLR